jgi:hypothetical protein
MTMRLMHPSSVEQITLQSSCIRSIYGRIDLTLYNYFNSLNKRVNQTKIAGNIGLVKKSGFTIRAADSAFRSSGLLDAIP